MRDIILNLISFIYKIIFHEKMGDDARKFIKNLSFIMVASGIAAILSTAFNIFAGRVLGPAEYGEFTLIQTIATFLIIPMMFGLDNAMIRYTAEKNEFGVQSSIITTTFILISIVTLISISVYYLFSFQISKIFSISTNILYLAIIFAVLSVISTLSTGTLRSLHKMKEYAIFQPLPNVITLVTFLAFIGVNFVSSKSALFSTYLGIGITGFIMLFAIRKYLKFNFEKYWTKKLVSYGLYASLGGLSSVFYGNIDKIIIYKYLTIIDIGIYRAYYFASINFIGLFIGMFISVFFPMVCKYEDKNIILNRIKRVLFYLVIIGFPFIVFFEFIILKFYGSEYPFNLEMALFFGIGGILTFINSIYSWLLNAIGTEGIKHASFAAMIMGLVNILLNFLLIPQIGIMGAIITMIISYMIGIGIIVSRINYMVASHR